MATQTSCRMKTDLIRSSFQRKWVSSSKSIAEIHSPQQISCRGLSDTSIFSIFCIQLKSLNLLIRVFSLNLAILHVITLVQKPLQFSLCRLEFEARNKKKETKELAVLEYLEQKKRKESEKEDTQPEIPTA